MTNDDSMELMEAVVSLDEGFLLKHIWNRITTADLSKHTNNRVTNIVLTLGGTSLTQAQWARKLGIAEQTIRRRLQRGLPLDKVLQQKKTITRQ